MDVVLCQINKRTWKDSFLQRHSEERTSAPSECMRQLGCSKDQEPSLAVLWEQNTITQTHAWLKKAKGIKFQIFEK